MAEEEEKKPEEKKRQGAQSEDITPITPEGQGGAEKKPPAPGPSEPTPKPPSEISVQEKAPKTQPAPPPQEPATPPSQIKYKPESRGEETPPPPSQIKPQAPPIKPAEKQGAAPSPAGAQQKPETEAPWTKPTAQAPAKQAEPQKGIQPQVKPEGAQAEAPQKGKEEKPVPAEKPEPAKPAEKPSPAPSAAPVGKEEPPHELKRGRKRIATGMAGLDEMLGGGIPQSNNVLVAGGPGCGKTSFAMEYLARGADQGEKGLYVTLEEVPENIISNVKASFESMKENIDKHVENKNIFVLKPENFDIMTIGETISKYVIEQKVSRVVIDSTTMLSMAMKEEAEYRMVMYEFLKLLGGMDCTTFLVYERRSPRREDVEFTVEQYVTDGIINLYNLERGETRVRSLEIMKMRGCNHSQNIVPFRITPKGIQIFKGEKVY